MPASKLVVKRQKSSQSVQAAGSTHRDRIARGIAQTYGAQFESPIRDLINAMNEQLQARTTEMVAADEADQNERADDDEPRARRDSARVETSAALRDARAIIETNVSADFAAKLGFIGETPEDPVALQRLAAQVVGNLEKLTAPAPRVEDFVFKPEKYRNRISDGLAKLSQAIKDVAREATEADDSLNVKNRSIEANDATFSRVANLTSALLDFIGEKDLAGKVRPSPRRSGQTVEQASDEAVGG